MVICGDWVVRDGYEWLCVVFLVYMASLEWLCGVMSGYVVVADWLWVVICCYEWLWGGFWWF